jgi:hypothetical protein
MECVSRQEIWTIFGLLATIACAIAAFLVVPELRTYLGLNSASPTPKQRRRRRIMTFLLYMFIGNTLLFLLWLLLCPWADRKIAPCLPPSPTPTPSPTQEITGSPSPTPSPVVESTPPVAQTTPLGGPVVVHGPVTGTDDKGKEAEFNLYVFERDHYWMKESYNVLFNGEVVTDEQMAKYISSIHGDMKLVDAIISVGAASSGIEENEEGEEDRAVKRAIKLNKWIRLALKDSQTSPLLRLLTLGHYRQPPDRDEQRLIIIIGVRKIDAEVNLDQVLSQENAHKLRAQLMSKRFPFNFYDYSKFDILPES